MNPERKTREPVTLRGVLVTAGIGLAIGAVVLILRDGFAPTDEAGFWMNITDALTVPGILLVCAGLLSSVSEHGAFDGLGYPVRKALGQVRSEARRAEMPKTYYDYVTRRQEKQRLRPRTRLYVGIAFLLLAGAALMIYQAKV